MRTDFSFDQTKRSEKKLGRPPLLTWLVALLLLLLLLPGCGQGSDER